jgi:hypothetical protein
MPTVSRRHHGPDPASPLNRLSTTHLLGQFATTKLTGATRCPDEQDERHGDQRQTEFDLWHESNAFRVVQGLEV